MAGNFIVLTTGRGVPLNPNSGMIPGTGPTAGLSVNFYTGGSTQVQIVPSAAKQAHAFLMFFSWGLILPFGMLFARYGRSIPDGFWFKVHRPVQYLGYAVAIVGFIEILSVLRNFGTFYHHYMGVIIMTMGFIQIMIAVVRPHKEPGTQPTTLRIIFEYFHWWNGRLALLFFIYQFYTGASLLYGGGGTSYPTAASFGLVYAYSALLGITFIVMVILEIRNCTSGNSLKITPCFPCCGDCCNCSVEPISTSQRTERLM